MAIYNHIYHVVLKVILLCVLSSFAACTDQKVASETNHITFDISNSDGWNSVSRGAELTQSALNTKGFGVFAYYTENKNWSVANMSTPNFMNNTKATKSDTSWQYSPIKYWPDDPRDKVSFFAYAPYNAGQTATGSKLNFSVATDVDNQVDLVWSNSATVDLNKNTSPVSFTFKHSLARVGFTVNAMSEGVSPLREGMAIRIKKVAIKGLYTSGILDMSNTSEVAEWSNESGNGEYSIEPANFVGKNADGFLLNSANTSSTAHKLNLDDAYIMVIPQDFSSTGLNVYVEYEVELASKDKDGNWDVYHKYTNQCVGMAKVNLEPNKTYIINITTDLENVTVDDISITSWEDGGDVNIGGIVPDIV